MQFLVVVIGKEGSDGNDTSGPMFYDVKVTDPDGLCHNPHRSHMHRTCITPRPLFCRFLSGGGAPSHVTERPGA